MKLTTLPLLLLVCLFVACNNDGAAADTEAEETATEVEIQPSVPAYQTYDKATGEAMIADYEQQLAAADSDVAKVDILAKSAAVYFRMGASAGLQENFARILNDYPTAPNSDVMTQNLLDTLLYSITDPQTQRLTPSVARDYIALTEAYAQARPDAAESPQQLYKAGEIARSIGEFQKALSIYSTIENYFPQYDKAPKALFMQAFTYAEDLKNEDKARELYEAFIAKYPQDDFVDDAQMLLQTLGKSDEEIFQQLENQQ